MKSKIVIVIGKKKIELTETEFGELQKIFRSMCPFSDLKTDTMPLKNPTIKIRKNDSVPDPDAEAMPTNLKKVYDPTNTYSGVYGDKHS